MNETARIESVFGARTSDEWRGGEAMPGLDRTARILLPPHRVLDVDIAPRARCPHHIRGGVAAAMDESAERRVAVARFPERGTVQPRRWVLHATLTQSRRSDVQAHSVPRAARPRRLRAGTRGAVYTAGIAMAHTGGDLPTALRERDRAVHPRAARVRAIRLRFRSNDI